MKYVSVENHSSLVRDPNTNAVININKQEVQQARERKKSRLEESKRFQDLQQQSVDLGQEVKDLRQLVLQLIDKEST